MNNYKNIDETIADALAEEEVKKMNESKKITLTDVKTMKPEPMIEVQVDEYVSLRQLKYDLERIVRAIVSDLKLNYSGDALYSAGEETLKAFEVIYPDMAALMLKELKERKAEKAAQKDKEVKTVWDKDDEEGE